MPKILVAEDEPDIQEMLVFMLQREGYAVVAAANGAEAYERAQAEKPDLILMDIRMPHVDGYAATRLIKADPALHHIPVIYVSVRSALDEKQAGRAADAVGYVNKPFAPAEIMRQVKEALAGRPPTP